MGFSLLAAIESCSLFVVVMPLIVVASLGAWALGHTGFSCCGVWAQQLWLPGSRAQAW